MSGILNTLHSERLARGWTQEQTARAAGITRQSYAAIEAATSVPSTEVALRLAHAFGRTVEALFRLPDVPPPVVAARWAGENAAPGQPARLYRVAGDLLAHAVGEGDIVSRPADGTVVRRTEGSVEIALLPGRPPVPVLAVAGCDPAIGLVAEALLQGWGMEITWLPRGSRAALAALAAGEAHIAGAHLRDPLTGEFNEGAVREMLPFPCTRVSFAWWDQGLLVAPGNPLGVTDVSSLPRPRVRFLNREPGSGSRTLIDDRLAEAGIPADVVTGYETRARGHMAVAQAISAGLADVGVGIRAAARAYGLDHLRLDTERYDLVIPNHFLDLPAVGALLDLLRGPGVRAQVEALGGYDASVMGQEC